MAEKTGYNCGPVSYFIGIFGGTYASGASPLFTQRYYGESGSPSVCGSESRDIGSVVRVDEPNRIEIYKTIRPASLS